MTEPTDDIIREKAVVARIKAAAQEMNNGMRRAHDMGLMIEVGNHNLSTNIGTCPWISIQVSKRL